MTRGDRKARVHSGLIGWGLNRIHRCSEALALADPPILPGITGLCSPDLAATTRIMSVTETGQHGIAQRPFRPLRNARKYPRPPSLPDRAWPASAEIQSRPGPIRAALAGQHRIEPVAQGMQMQHVGGGISELGLAQGGRTPIARLLLFRQIDVEHLAHQILQAMAIGVGAAKPGGDLGAVDRLRHHPEGVVERGQIEPREMKDFRDLRVRQQRLQIGGVGMNFGICTTSALPSPFEICTTQSRSRCGCSPMVSVSIATKSV